MAPECDYPGDDSTFVYRFRRKKIHAFECCFCDERAGDAVGDRIHK